MKSSQYTIPKRLKLIIDERNLSMKDFSYMVNVPYQTMHSYFLGRRKIGLDALMGISHCGIDINWLMTGEGTMYKSESKNLLIERQNTLQDLIEWIKDFEDKADDKQWAWLETQIKRNFPEFEQWQQHRYDAL